LPAWSTAHLLSLISEVLQCFGLYSGAPRETLAPPVGVSDQH
jgi:hypothetical protein